MFEKVSPNLDFVNREVETVHFWKKHDIFEKSIKNREGGLCRLIECCYCPDSRRIYQSDKGDLCRFSWNTEGIARPSPRADSLPEYAVRMAEAPQPF